MSEPPAWAVERWRGRAAEFHGRDLPSPVVRAVWVLDVAAPALALGSTQRPDVVVPGAAERLGVDVLRRRSGGGAVLLWPGEVLWVDVLLPRGDPLWDDDVGRSSGWLGDVWAAALEAGGTPGGHVHRGALACTSCSRLVCFAGTGPGEVTAPGGGKLVGISQRRTRQGARFQCAVHARWRPEGYADLLGAPVAEIAGAAATVPDLEALLAAFVFALPGGTA